MIADPGLGCWPVTLPLRLSSLFVLTFQVVHAGDSGWGVVSL